MHSQLTYSIVYPIIYAQFNHYDTVSFLAERFVSRKQENCTVQKEIYRLRHTHVFFVCEIKRNLFLNLSFFFKCTTASDAQSADVVGWMAWLYCCWRWFYFGLLCFLCVVQFVGIIYTHPRWKNGSKSPIKLSGRAIRSTNYIDLKFCFSISILAVNWDIKFTWPKKKEKKKSSESRAHYVNLCI